MTMEASDTMLVAATGAADAFWRASAWYLSILVDVRPQTGRTQVWPKWKKWRKLFFEWRKLLSELRKFFSKRRIFCIFLAGLELLPRGRNSWPFVRTQGTCIRLLVPFRNVISERRML